MSALDIAVKPMPDGVDLVIKRAEGDDLVVPLSHDRAMAFLLEWWDIFSASRMPAQPDAPALSMLPGPIGLTTIAGADGLVHLKAQSGDAAGVTYDLAEAEARELARSLLEAAEIVQDYKASH